MIGSQGSVVGTVTRYGVPTPTEVKNFTSLHLPKLALGPFLGAKATGP